MRCNSVLLLHLQIVNHPFDPARTASELFGARPLFRGLYCAVEGHDAVIGIDVDPGQG